MRSFSLTKKTTHIFLVAVVFLEDPTVTSPDCSGYPATRAGKSSGVTSMSGKQVPDSPKSRGNGFVGGLADFF